MSKLLHLEGIRGLCALLVFWIHFLPRFAPILLSILTLYQPRYIPVPIFFIISGRVLTASALHHRRTFYISSSVVRRPFRLVLPTIGIMILNHYIKRWNLLPFSNKLDTITGWEDIVLRPFHFVVFGGPHRKPLLGVAWTLPIEFQGSILVYLLSFMFLSWPADAYRPRLVVCGVLLVYTCYCSSWLSHFVVRLMIADFSNTSYFRSYKQWKYSIFVSSIILAVVAKLTLFGKSTYGAQVDAYLRRMVLNNGGDRGASLEFWQSNLSLLILCTAMMLYVELVPPIQHLFALSPFVYLGRVSFCLYLFHPTFVETIGSLIVTRIGSQTKSECHWSLFVSSVILIMISEILTRLIDNPSVWITNYLEKGLVKGDWTINSPLLNTIVMFVVKFVRLCFRTIVSIPVGIQNRYRTQYQHLNSAP